MQVDKARDCSAAQEIAHKNGHQGAQTISHRCCYERYTTEHTQRSFTLHLSKCYQRRREPQLRQRPMFESIYKPKLTSDISSNTPKLNHDSARRRASYTASAKLRKTGKAVCVNFRTSNGELRDESGTRSKALNDRSRTRGWALRDYSRTTNSEAAMDH